MSIFSVGPENFELITIQASPKRFYISSSFPSTWGFGGITGSAELFARKSDMIKEVAPRGVLSSSNFNEDSCGHILKNMSNTSVRVLEGNINNQY